MKRVVELNLSPPNFLPVIASIGDEDNLEKLTMGTTTTTAPVTSFFMKVRQEEREKSLRENFLKCGLSP